MIPSVLSEPGRRHRTPHVREAVTPTRLVALLMSIFALALWVIDAAIHTTIVTHGQWNDGSLPILTLKGWLLMRHALAFAALAAPLIATRWTALGAMAALGPLLPADVVGPGYQLPTLTCTAGIGVAVVTTIRRPVAGWVLATIPLAFAAVPVFYRPGKVWAVSGGGNVILWQATTQQRVVEYGTIVLVAVALMMAATALRLLLDRRHERRAVDVRESEVDARAELARDLHDVVAHRMSLVAVRAETAPYSLGDLSPQTREAFVDIAAEARGALDEMRTVLGGARSFTDRRGVGCLACAEWSGRATQR